jgi:MFS family permease
VDKQQHASAWGILGAFKSLGLLLAPLLAAILLEMHQTYPFLLVIGFLLAAMAMFLLLRLSNKRSAAEQPSPPEEPIPSQAPRSTLTQLKIWFTLMHKIWPVYLFFFAFIVLETSFWSVGPLVMEELRHKHLLGGMLLSFYIAPSFFVPLYVQKLGRLFGKKRTAFVSATIGATLLAIGGLFFSTEWYFPLIVLASALFLSLDYPSIEAVFEDYMSRIHDYGNDLVGLRGTAASLAYIVGPTAAGALALTVGGGKTIGIFAAILAVISLILLAITPRKIKMPQGELEEAVNENTSTT